MDDLTKAAQAALEALEAQHRDRTAYGRAKRSANATCGEFKNSPLAELIESGYMHSMGKQTQEAMDALRAALAAQQAEPVLFHGGMSNDELRAAWDKKLHCEPKGQELSAFAVGIEVGFAHAQDLERQDWSRVHHVLKKHGVHPGRTDDHLADVIDKALAQQDAQPVAPQHVCGLQGYGALGDVCPGCAAAQPQQAPSCTDPHCPCRDGDTCHYKDGADGTKAWAAQPQQAMWPGAWREMIEDTKEVFDFNGAETPQIVRDVIEYASSWLQVAEEKAAQQAAQPVAFDHDIGADRYQVVKGSFWWHVRIGDSTANVGKFHTKMAAEDMALKLLTAFRDGAFMQSRAAQPVAWGQLGMLNGKTYLRMNYDRTPYPPPADVVRNLNLVPLFAAAQPQQAADELGWLIEMQFGDGLLWWSGCFDDDGTYPPSRLIARMVNDVNKAVRFSRREDAQRVLDAMLAAQPCPLLARAKTLYSVHEHMWPEAAQPQQDAECKPYGDLRNAKWLDPECYGAGACQSLKFKAAQQAAQPVAQEPIHIEAVAEVVLDDDDVPTLRWLVEGGIADLPAGMVLMISDLPLTDDYGSGEVFRASQPQQAPLKERPDFVAGYDAGLADGRRIAEREQAAQPVAWGSADVDGRIVDICSDSFKRHSTAQWANTFNVPLYAVAQPVAPVKPEPVAALVRYRSLMTEARIAHDHQDHFSDWGEWYPATLGHAKVVTDPARNTDPCLFEMVPLFAAAQPQQAAPP